MWHLDAESGSCIYKTHGFENDSNKVGAIKLPKSELVKTADKCGEILFSC